MNNHRQEGSIVYVAAPANVVSGEFVVVGSLHGIAGYDALQNAIVPLHTEGIYSLPRTTGETWTVGQLLYWAAGTGKLTNVKGSNHVVGVATALAPDYTSAATGAATYGDVRLNPSF